MIFINITLYNITSDKIFETFKHLEFTNFPSSGVNSRKFGLGEAKCILAHLVEQICRFVSMQRCHLGGGGRGGQMPTPDFPGGPSFHQKGSFAGHNNNTFCY